MPKLKYEVIICWSDED